MAYYNYLNKYTPQFLRTYQAGRYGQLARRSNYADIVDMNATSSLTLDEDLSFRLRVPHRLANFLGVIVMMYWYYYHVHLYQADTFRYRLRSYHTYKMWSRLEILATKHGQGTGDEYQKLQKDFWIFEHGFTREQFEDWEKRVSEGVNPSEALEAIGLRFDEKFNKVVPL